MTFHVKRSNTAQNSTLSSFNGARTTTWKRPREGQSVLEIQTIRDPSVLLNVPDDKNPLNPPYHWHWTQEEYFHIREGRYIFTLEGKETTISSSDPQPTIIPPGARHTFRADPTCPTQCVIEISTGISSANAPSADPEQDGVSERFFRNLYSYLEDCGEQGVQPSPPQLLLFLHSAEVSLAFSWGPSWLMRFVSWGLGLVVGKWFGGYVLGYRESYVEYYDPSEGKKGR